MTDELEKSLETMDDYADELEASFKKIREGDILTGTVIGVSETASLSLRIIPATRPLIPRKTFTWEMRSRLR